ncbi:MAG: lytic murein transglycosylase [Mailhella sp.]|nr:lytic murein transglycosylase [Mailhella sp.]
MKKTFCLLILLAALAFSQSSCAAGKKSHAPSSVPAAAASIPAQKTTQEEPAWTETWQQLSQKLKQEGLDSKKIDALFQRVDTPPSLKPMGIKITELYSNHYLPKTKKHAVTPFETELGIPGPWFKGVVTNKNAQAYSSFIEANASAFALAKLSSGVPQKVTAALLFVETRLGTYLGKDHAFHTLASMAVSRSPEAFSAYLDKLPGAYEHLAWIQKKMDLRLTGRTMN